MVGQYFKRRREAVEVSVQHFTAALSRLQVVLVASWGAGLASVGSLVHTSLR